LPELTEPTTVREQSGADEAADRERLSLTELDDLLGRGGPRTSQHDDRRDSEHTQRCDSRSHDTPSVKGA